MYTDEYSEFAGIRFYDFFSGAPGAIVTPAGSIDQLSSVDGSQIAFSRVTGLSRACMVFDVETLATVQIGPSDARAFAAFFF